MKAYIIMKKGYEYDDNIYNPTDGGFPQKVFFNREDAQAEIIKLEISEMKSEDISNFAYDLNEELNVEESEFLEFTKSLNEKYGIPAPKYSWDIPSEYQLNEKASEEESLKYLEMIQVRFFEIEEVEVDKSSFRDWKIESIIS